VKSQLCFHYTLPNSYSFRELARKLSGAGTERQDDQSRALNEEQHTEYNRYG
jgi:hypothetical protein